MTVDFRLSAEDRELVDQSGRALRKYLPASRLVAGEPASDGWRSVADEGWLHAGLIDEDGIEGLPLVLVAAIGREAGMVLAGDGYVDNAVILPRLVGGGADLSWREQLLLEPGFLVSVEGSNKADQAYGVEPGLSAYRLAGGRVERYDSTAWQFTPEGGLGVTSGTLDILQDAEAEASHSLGASDLDGIWSDARIVHAATLVGSGQAAMNDTLEHVKSRVQFGAAIGRFQAVKHMLAEVSVDLEVAWNAVLYAALKPSPSNVSIASLQASRAADKSARAMIQLFGGIAMTWEHHAHWYVKIIETSRRRFGSSAEHALKLADSLTVGGVK